MKFYFTILAVFAVFCCSAQQQKLAIGIGTTGTNISYESTIKKEFSFGGSVSLLHLNGSMMNVIYDNLVISKYNISTAIIEGFVKWYPTLNNKNYPKKINDRLYAKAGLAYNTNPSYSLNSTFFEKTYVGEMELTKEQVGYVKTNFITNRIQPFLMAGYSFINKQQFFANVELGSYLHGRPQIEMEATGILHSNVMNQEALQKVFSSYQFYPVLKLEFGIKINNRTKDK